jgi:hypothetical protein
MTYIAEGGQNNNRNFKIADVETASFYLSLAMYELIEFHL